MRRRKDPKGKHGTPSEVQRLIGRQELCCRRDADKFSSDFRWVLYRGETNGGEGLFLAPVEMPKER